MPPRDWNFRIQDILDAVAAVQTYTAGMTFEAFTLDRRTFSPFDKGGVRKIFI